MARWEPDAQQRLSQAALELFLEKGYENTTVIDIVERAGLTKSTFFRHFRDKREVLFAGEDLLLKMFGEAIAGASEVATPLEAIGAALAIAGTVFTAERHESAVARRQVVARNSELQEREALKRDRSAEVMAAALRERGVAAPDATLAAQLGVLAFRQAFVRWAVPGNRIPFVDLARQCLQELRTSSTSLS